MTVGGKKKKKKKTCSLLLTNESKHLAKISLAVSVIAILKVLI